MPGREHAPSRYRALVSEAKRGRGGRPIHVLLREARSLDDPYFVALALFELSSDPRLRPGEALEAVEGAFGRVEDVAREWRRAELLAELARLAPRWREVAARRSPRAAAEREELLDRIVKLALGMPEGKGLSDALQGLAPRVPARHLPAFLDRALENGGFEEDDAKAVLRAWAREGGADAARPRLRDIPDAARRAKLLGYLHLQLRKAGARLTEPTPLDDAVDAAAAEDDAAARLDVLRYLGLHVAADLEGLRTVREAADGLPDAANRARLLTTLAGSVDKAGHADVARAWVEDALRLARALDDAHDRSATLTNLAQALQRLGDEDAAARVGEEAVESAGGVEDEVRRARLLQRVDNAVPGLDVEAPAKPAPRAAAREAPVPRRGRHAIALHDTYEGGLNPAHLRAVARAAPLCYAYDLDLVLIGFPVADLGRLVEQVTTETNIGQGGRFLHELADAGRIHLVSENPEEWEGLGLPVATTPRPAEGKATSLEDAVGAADEGRVCLVMGLGKKGLPPSLLGAMSRHLELTGRNVPLETATVMGILAERLRRA